MGHDKVLFTVLRWVALVVASVAQLGCGNVFSFAVYQNPLKATYNYTQSEAAVLASLSNFGAGVAFIPGMVFDRFGPTVTSFIGLILSFGGYLLIWSTVQTIDFYTDKSWLTGIYFFVGGNGSAFIYIAALNTSIMNFHAKRRGTIGGLMNACFALGPTVFILIYYQFFVHGPNDIDSNHDYSGFMLTSAVVFGIVGLLSVIFLRTYKHGPISDDARKSNSDVTEMRSGKFSKKGSYHLNDVDGVHCIDVSSDSSEVKTHSDNNINVELEKEIGSKTSQSKKESFFDVLRNFDFHLLLWMFGISSAVGIVQLNNITTTTKSLSQTSYDTYAVLITPLVAAAASISVGPLSDHLKSRWPRSYFLALDNVFYILAGIIYTAWGDHLTAFMIATALCGAGMGVSWSVPLTHLSEVYGTDHFGRNWGIFMIFSAIVVFGLQQIFAALYDAEITSSGDIVCYGFKCIQSGYGMLLSFSVTGSFLNVALIVRETRQRRQ